MLIDFHGITVSVDGDNLGVLHALKDYTQPYFAWKSCSDDTAKISIRLGTQSDRFFAQRRVEMSSVGQAITLHADMAGMVAKDGGATETLYMNDAFLVSVRNREVHVVTTSWGNQEVLEAVRLIRGILGGLAASEFGMVRGHGAAVRVPSDVVLFIGQKGAGKTSFVTSLLRSDGTKAQFITNDKCVLDENRAVWGIPYAVAISPEALVETPQLQSLATDRRVTSSGKLLYWPDQYAKAFDRNTDRGGIVTIAVLPHLDLTDKCVRYRPANEPEVVQALNTLTTDDDDVHPQWLCKQLNLDIQKLNSETISQVFATTNFVVAEGNPWYAEFCVDFSRSCLLGGSRKG